MLKVVHLYYRLSSSGNFAVRLHNEFLKAGIDSSILSLYSEIGVNDRIKIVGKKNRFIARLDNQIQSYLTRKNVKKYGAFSYPILGTNIAKMEQIKQADIIYLHWVLNGFLNLKNIEQLAKLNKPIIFFMHDMWPITGGCHHSFECEKYKIRCNNCQMFNTHKKNDLSALEFDKKFKLYSKFDNLFFVSPSKWLFECATKSMLTKGKPVFYIPNVIDNKLFKPFDKKVAKKILNLNPEDTVIAFGALKTDSPYKGWSYLLKSLEIFHKNVDRDNITVLIFGSGNYKEISEAIPFRTKFMGYLRDDYSTVLAYNAADVFIAPSLADNLPYTVFEAICCGTPVVAFEVGGIPDLIEHKVNGYLAKYKDSEDIANGIKYCLERKISGSMLPNFETSLTIKKHLNLFAHIKSLNYNT